MGNCMNVSGEYWAYVRNKMGSGKKYQRIYNQLEKDSLSSILVNAESKVFYIESRGLPTYVIEDIICWAKRQGYMYLHDLQLMKESKMIASSGLSA